MSEWEVTKCLLCGSKAKRYVFMDARGWKYDQCEGGCRPYGIRGVLHEDISLFISDAADRKRIADLLKAEVAKQPITDEFFEITRDHLHSLGLLLHLK